MDKVRYGIVGMGNQGSYYAFTVFKDGKLGDAVITAVCDHNPAKLERAKNLFGDTKVEYFDNYIDMMDSGLCDAILVEIPHYFHPEVVKECFKRGLHVICEKPAGVYTKQVREMNEASKDAKCLFGMMFNQRTNCVYRKMREMIADGAIGSLQRVTWIITDWYRTEAYYSSGDWRATWKGEGGGVLFNQCPHQLDLLQWVVGKMPSALQSFCRYGQWHNIEVEDDVTTYLEYDNGATGVFITTTGEYPGTNRFEVSGSKGKLICENNELIYYRNSQDSFEVCKTSDQGFATIPYEVTKIETDGLNLQHEGIIRNFTDAVLGKDKLFVSGVEGINGVELMDAMELSAWLGKKVTLPIDEDLYLDELQKRIAESKEKKNVKETVADTAGSF